MGDFLELDRTWAAGLEASVPRVTEIVLTPAGVNPQDNHRQPRCFEVQATLLRAPRISSRIILLVLRDIQDRKVEEEKLRYLAVTDVLTGAHNRRNILCLAEDEIVRARRSRQTLSVILIDVDHFKEVNDRCGHQAGDLVLEEVAAACQTNLRSQDIFGRYGGDEFMVVLPGMDCTAAGVVAERLRQAVEALHFTGQAEGVCCTISLGAAGLPARGGLGLDSLLERADRALYRAKAAGRNRVHAH